MEMFDNYFTYWSDLPEQDAFSVFGPVHMIWLIAEAALICVGVYIYRKKDYLSKEYSLCSFNVLFIAFFYYFI